jgi:hypothetical protein
MQLIAEKREPRNRTFDSKFVNSKEIKMKTFKYVCIQSLMFATVISLSIIVGMLLTTPSVSNRVSNRVSSLRTSVALAIAPTEIKEMAVGYNKLTSENIKLASINSKLAADNELLSKKLASALIPESTVGAAFTNHVKNPLIRTSANLYDAAAAKLEALKITKVSTTEAVTVTNAR